MFDAKGLLDQFLGGQNGKGGPGEFMKGAGGGALAGGLAAILLGTKTGRNVGGEALKLGGMAAVGAMAYKAYRDWQAGKQAPSAPTPATVPPAQPSVPMLPAPMVTITSPSRAIWISARGNSSIFSTNTGSTRPCERTARQIALPSAPAIGVSPAA